MKKIMLPALVLGLLLSSFSWSQESAKKLTNQDVVEMAGLGLSDDVIIAKIQSAAAVDLTVFDTSVEGLRQLKAAKVSDAVIKVMVNPKAAAPATSRNPNLPPDEVGVYWKDGAQFVPIEGQNVNHAKMGGKLGSAFSYGIKPRRWEATIEGNTSKNRINGNEQAFYIYCPDGMSASDYQLIRLQVKKDRREFQIGTVGGITQGKSGVRDSSIIPFKSERIAPRTYKVTLDSELKGGEYGFFMGTGQAMTVGSEAGGYTQGRIFDFTVPE